MDVATVVEWDEKLVRSEAYMACCNGDLEAVLVAADRLASIADKKNPTLWIFVSQLYAMGGRLPESREALVSAEQMFPQREMQEALIWRHRGLTVLARLGAEVYARVLQAGELAVRRLWPGDRDQRRVEELTRLIDLRLRRAGLPRVPDTFRTTARLCWGDYCEALFNAGMQLASLQLSNVDLGLLVRALSESLWKSIPLLVVVLGKEAVDPLAAAVYGGNAVDPAALAALGNELLTAVGRRYDLLLEQERPLSRHYQLGLECVDRGDLQQALVEFTHGLRLAPNLAELYNNRGTVYNQMRRHAEALLDFDRAIEMEPHIEIAYCNRGAIYNDVMQQPEKAMEDFNRVLELSPHCGVAYLNRGTAYLSLNRPQDAIRDFDCAIALEVEPSHAHYNRGTAYLWMDRWVEAKRDFDLALKSDSRHAEAYVNRAVCCIALGHHEQAVKDLDRGLQLKPSLVNAYYHRGMAFAYLGLGAQATRDLNRYLLSDSKSEMRVRAREMLGRLSVSGAHIREWVSGST